MKTLGKWLIIVMIFFLGTIAILNIDQQCKEMTGVGGDVVETVKTLGQ